MDCVTPQQEPQPPYGQAPQGQSPHGQQPQGEPPYDQDPYGQAQYGQDPYGQAQYGQAQYGQQPWGQPSAGYGPAFPEADGNSDDRMWSTIAHAGSFLAAWLALGMLCPILVLLGKSSRPFVRRHAYESLNFQLNAAALYLLFVVVGGITLGIGYVVLALPAVGYICFYAWCVVRASIAANRGEEYRYPLTVRVFNP